MYQLVVQLWLIPAGSCLGVSSKMSAQRILLKKILTCTVAELDWRHCDDGCLVLGPFRVDFFIFLCCLFLSLVLLLFCLSSSVTGCVSLPSASRHLGTIPCTVVIDSSQCELLNVYYLQTFCYCSPVVFTVSGTLILWLGWWYSDLVIRVMVSYLSCGLGCSVLNSRCCCLKTDLVEELLCGVAWGSTSLLADEWLCPTLEW